MKTATRIKYNAYVESLAIANGLPDVGTVSKKYNVVPSVQQRLEDRIQESSAFLQSINIIGVTEQEGEKIGIGVTGPNASTTDTTSKDRTTTDLLALDDAGYKCMQTNFDTHIRYATLDMWAKFEDFAERLRAAIVKRQALDRIMIGWNGTSRAATSNPTTNPLRQDVNKGWLQKLREEAAARVMDEVVDSSGKVNVGATGDYKNLDALVFDAINNLIDPWHRESNELVVICGSKILADKYFPLINDQSAPTEKLAADVIVSAKRIGGKQAVQVPFFPADKILITPMANLSLYFQEGARRRTVVDNAKRDQIENYESSNDAYVIEDTGAAALIENITLV